jgi:glycosyltransferase involved in cell wall biosynthesis
VPRRLTGRPAVSVVLAARDEERRIGRAIESIRAQTLPDWELVVVDDGSRDATSAVVERVADDRITLLRRPRRGLAAALNDAVSAARAPFVARQDADDYSLPHRLEVQLAFLRANPEVAVVGSDWFELDRNGERVRPRARFIAGSVNRVLPRFNPLMHTSVIFRRDVFDAVRGYDATLPHVEDYDLWLRLDEAGHTLWNVPEQLVVHAMTGENVAATRERAQLRGELALRWRDLQRRRRAHLPIAVQSWMLARRAPVLLAPIPLRRLVRRFRGKAP